MEPGKADELIQILGLAREEASRSVALGATREDRGDELVAREIRNPRLTRASARRNIDAGTGGPACVPQDDLPT